MSNIFISYSSKKNRSLIKEVFAGLIKSLGYDVWIDTESIGPSKPWKPSLIDGLEGADWFLVIVSREATRSDWVKRETEWAIDNLKKNRVIPVVIDDSTPADVHPRLSDYQHLNYRNEPARTIQELVKLLVDAKYRGYDRDLSGDWISAVQPVYYPTKGWVVQNVKAVATSDGYTIKTVEPKDNLQWRFDAKFIENAFLAGPWRSTGEWSRSQGFMTLQLSRKGTFMCGHDYGMIFDEAKARFGVLLLARKPDALEKARAAMIAARRKIAPLTVLHDFNSERT